MCACLQVYMEANGLSVKHLNAPSTLKTYTKRNEYRRGQKDQTHQNKEL